MEKHLAFIKSTISQHKCIDKNQKQSVLITNKFKLLLFIYLLDLTNQSNHNRTADKKIVCDTVIKNNTLLKLGEKTPK